MKFGIVLSAVVALTLVGSGASFAATHGALAPLDEYFGKQKMSPLGIENTIHDTSLRVRYDPAHAARYYQGLESAEDALHDWARKYPKDPWLAGRAYYMSHCFLVHAHSAGRCCRSPLPPPALHTISRFTLVGARRTRNPKCRSPSTGSKESLLLEEVASKVGTNADRHAFKDQRHAANIGPITKIEFRQHIETT